MTRSAHDADPAEQVTRPIGTRWIVGTVLVAAIVIGCLSAGFWQLRRLGERKETNALVEARADRLVDLPVAGFDSDAAVDDLSFLRVRVSGTYDPAHEVLVRFRSHKGLPGYEVLTPLVTGDGAVLVNRGWVPLDQGDRWPVDASAPPSGEVAVEGVLVPAERGPLRRSAPRTPGSPAIVAAVDPRRLDGVVARADVYALPMLAAGSSKAYPVPVEPPGLGEGPHRSYAVQWFLFAGVGVVGWIILLRKRGPLSRVRASSLGA